MRGLARDAKVIRAQVTRPPVADCKDERDEASPRLLSPAGGGVDVLPLEMLPRPARHPFIRRFRAAAQAGRQREREQEPFGCL